MYRLQILCSGEKGLHIHAKRSSNTDRWRFIHVFPKTWPFCTDLNPCDFLLYGHLKKSYLSRRFLLTLAYVKESITLLMRSISIGYLRFAVEKDVYSLQILHFYERNYIKHHPYVYKALIT